MKWLVMEGVFFLAASLLRNCSLTSLPTTASRNSLRLPDILSLNDYVPKQNQRVLLNIEQSSNVRYLGWNMAHVRS